MGLELLRDSYSVLHIEDHIGDADLVSELLKECAPDGFEITHVGAVRKAVPLLHERRYDIILLDLSLPDAYGAESIEALHDLAPDTPIVVLSGMECEKLLKRSRQGGACEYLIKNHLTGPGLHKVLTEAIERNRARS